MTPPAPEKQDDKDVTSLPSDVDRSETLPEPETFRYGLSSPMVRKSDYDALKRRLARFEMLLDRLSAAGEEADNRTDEERRRDKCGG